MDAKTNQAAREIETWLKTLPGVTKAEPCMVTIGKESWAACYYEQVFMAPDGCKNPGPYTVHAYYMRGSLPRHYLRGGGHAYTLAGNKHEWYVAGYYAQNTRSKWDNQKNAPATEYHPFGANWMLHEWNVPDGHKIDYYETAAYARHETLIVPVVSFTDKIIRDWTIAETSHD